MTDRNQKANTEMATATNALLEASENFAQVLEKIRLAQLSLQEAIATSENRDKGCYQQIAGQMQGEFSTLMEQAQALESSFQQPMLHRMISSVKQPSN